MTNRTRTALFGAILAVTIIADQVSKVFVRATLPYMPPKSYGGGILTLIYTQNTGAFLSLGANLPPIVRTIIFSVFVAAALAVGAFVLLTGRVHNALDGVALALVIGGGIGNVIDRIQFHGSVTDFIYLAAGPLHTGVFNVADMAITLGVLWLAFSWVGEKKSDAPA
jgi:signal peptidase II